MINALEQQFFSYSHIAGEIPCNLESEKFITVQRKPPLKIYSLGFQPAKFIPEIPRWFLKKYASPSFTVLDPFCGSGTTLLEAIQQQISGYWLDYHPLSRLICQVKTTVFSPLDVLEATTQIIEKASTQKFVESTINFANKDFWFQQPVQEGLEILREHILLAESSLQPLLWLAFASTVRKTSNMNDGMILAARRPHIEKIPDRSRLDVFQYFQHYVKQSVEAFGEWNPFLNKFEAKIQQLSCQDARRLPEQLKVDAIITSPPYINAIDYVWASKFELHWLGLVNSNQERLNLYSKEIGTERIPKQECKELGKTGYLYLDKLIEDIYYGKKYQATSGQNQLRSRVVYQYFMDMKEHFLQSLQVLKQGGYYCFSVGDVSNICGVEIPVAYFLSEIAFDLGFKQIFTFNLLLKNRRLNLPRNVDWAGTIKHDTTIVLEKLN